MAIIRMEEWRDQLNTNEATAMEIARFVEELNARTHLGQLAPALPDLRDHAIQALDKALGIHPKELLVCKMGQYLSTLQCREVHYTSGGNLKYAIEGCRSLSDLVPFLSLEQLDGFRNLFEKNGGDKITTAMKLTLQPVFNQKTIGMVIAGFETTVEQYIGLLLKNAKREAGLIFPFIALFCAGNWPVCYFPEQERFLVLVA